MRERVKNKTGDEHCVHCCTSPGTIVVERVHYLKHIPHLPGDPANCRGCIELEGPCPFCERGYLLEFPPSGRPLWGPQGYWRGVAPLPSQVPIVCQCDVTPSPPPPETIEMFKRMAESLSLSKKLESNGLRNREPEASTERREQRERAERELQEALAKASVEDAAAELLAPSEPSNAPTTLL